MTCNVFFRSIVILDLLLTHEKKKTLQSRISYVDCTTTYVDRVDQNN